jgi:PTS system mannose-specific IIA component
MSVGILLITHSNVGKALLDTAEATLRTLPLAVEFMPVGLDANVAEITAKASRAAEELDSGQGVLVMTDAYGATPANIAVALCQNQSNRIALAGLNLPMLLRALNYPKLSLEELADVALQGGQRGVIRCP